jgi:putative flippase GtrA
MNAAPMPVPVSERKRFFAFLVVGGIAASANIAIRLALNEVMPYEEAILLAYIGGMIVAYTLNRSFVFAPSGRHMGEEGLRFVLINVLAACQVWVVSVGLARFLLPAAGYAWHTDTVAHVAGVLSPAVNSYFGHKHVSFRAKESAHVPAQANNITTPAQEKRPQERRE